MGTPSDPPDVPDRPASPKADQSRDCAAGAEGTSRGFLRLALLYRASAIGNGACRPQYARGQPSGEPAAEMIEERTG